MSLRTEIYKLVEQLKWEMELEFAHIKRNSRQIGARGVLQSERGISRNSVRHEMLGRLEVALAAGDDDLANSDRVGPVPKDPELMVEDNFPVCDCTDPECLEPIGIDWEEWDRIQKGVYVPLISPTCKSRAKVDAAEGLGEFKCNELKLEDTQ